MTKVGHNRRFNIGHAMSGEHWVQDNCVTGAPCHWSTIHSPVRHRPIIPGLLWSPPSTEPCGIMFNTYNVILLQSRLLLRSRSALSQFAQLNLTDRSQLRWDLNIKQTGAIRHCLAVRNGVNDSEGWTLPRFPTELCK